MNRHTTPPKKHSTDDIVPKTEYRRLPHYMVPPPIITDYDLSEGADYQLKPTVLPAAIYSHLISREVEKPEKVDITGSFSIYNLDAYMENISKITDEKLKLQKASELAVNISSNIISDFYLSEPGQAFAKLKAGISPHNDPMSNPRLRLEYIMKRISALKALFEFSKSENLAREYAIGLSLVLQFLINDPEIFSSFHYCFMELRKIYSKFDDEKIFRWYVLGLSDLARFFVKFNVGRIHTFFKDERHPYYFDEARVALSEMRNIFFDTKEKEFMRKNVIKTLENVKNELDYAEGDVSVFLNEVTNELKQLEDEKYIPSKYTSDTDEVDDIYNSEFNTTTILRNFQSRYGVVVEKLNQDEVIVRRQTRIGNSAIRVCINEPIIGFTSLSLMRCALRIFPVVEE